MSSLNNYLDKTAKFNQPEDRKPGTPDRSEQVNLAIDMAKHRPKAEPQPVAQKPAWPVAN